MTQDTGASVQIPVDLYVGVNVVRKHVAEFYYRAQVQNLLSAGEEVLAVFDCVILEPNGRRLGGLTLHDYAIFTSQNLITWGRGRRRDIVDKFSWADIAVDKYGRRTPIEGVVKFLYQRKPVGNKRKIAIGKRNGGDVAVETNVIPEVRSNLRRGGVALFLDLMPSGEVRTCVLMMNYLSGASGEVPTADGFREHFRRELDKSAQRLTTVSELLEPFYVMQPNGVYIEADAGEEEAIIKTLPNRYLVRGGVRESPYQLKGSPYQAGSPYQGSGRIARSAAPRVSASPSRAPIRTAASAEDINMSSVGRLNRQARQYATTASAVRANTSTRPRAGAAPRPIPTANTESSATTNVTGTVSLNTTPINAPSKLEAYERRGGSTMKIDIPAPEVRVISETTPTPAQRAEPVPRPPRPEREARLERPVRETGAARAMDEVPQELARGERALVEPVVVTLGRNALNVYSISRLARGLWIDPRNLGRNVGDVSETIGALIDVVGVVAEDSEARAQAFTRLRRAANEGTLANNIVFHYTIWPFLKPIIDLVSMPAETGTTTRNRVRVRTDVIGSAMPNMQDDNMLDDLPDMGAIQGTEEVTARADLTAVNKDPIPPADTTVTVVTDAPLNTSSRSTSTDATTRDEPPSPPSKLGNL